MDAFIWLVVVVIGLLIYWVRSRSDDETIEDCLPPGSMGLPFIGKSVEFAKKKIEFFREGHAKYGKIFKTRLFGKSIIRVYGSENIRTIIQGENKIVQSAYPASVRKLLGEQAISMSHGEIHKTKKRHLMKFLCPEFFANHTPVMAKLMSDRIGTWSTEPAIDLYKEVKNLFIELAARFLINIDLDDDDIAQLRDQLEIFTNNIFCLPVNIPGLGFNKALKARDIMRKMIGEWVTKSKNNNSSNELSSVLQSLLKESGEDADDLTLIDTIIDLLFSSAQTVSSAGCSVGYKLATDADVREKVLDNIREQNLLDTESTIFLNGVTKMSYVTGVVKETLRLLPPVGGAYRTALETFELDGYTIPKGWSISFSIRETHHNDSSLSDVDRFNPDRWLNSNSNNDRYSCIPFGAGSRVCPGQAYANMILKLFAIELTRSCTPTIVKDSEFTSWPLPKPKEQVLVRIGRK
ncbi:hypothetical protein ACF0H5_009473 [Mactra antiquata]